MVGPTGLPGESDLFFENVGNGRFVEATNAHGLSDLSRAYGFGVVSTDYDDDGFVDLFVANDSNPNFLYRNLGNGRFENAGLAAGVAVNGEARAQAGMGADAGDYDGDSRMDLVLTTFAHDRYTLYHNVDGRHFEDASTSAGIAGPTFVRMGWGTAFFDADLDGKLDLFFANGHIFSDIDAFPQLGETYRQKNQLLLNLGTRFRDVSDRAGAGLQLARVGRGLAVGDLDNDGDLDLVVSNTDDTPTLLENRQATKHHWVAVRAVAAAQEPIRHRRKSHDPRRRHKAGARDPLGRELPLAERPAGVLRARRLRRSRRRGDPHAGRTSLGLETASERPPAPSHALGFSQHPSSRHRPMKARCVLRTKRLLISGLLSACAVSGGTAQVEEQADYRPKLAVSETVEPFLKQLEPGSDGFPLERQAAELDARLRELSDALRGGGDRAADVTKGLLDPGFRGARLVPIEAAEASQAPLEVKRAKDLPRDPTLDARAFGAELRRLIGDVRDVAVAELLITAIEPDGPADSPSGLRTTVRYDIVGAGTKAYRVEQVGEWEMGWRRNASGWQVVRWTARSHLVSRARQPIFTEITAAALGGNDSFRRQLNIDLDSWMATFDSVLTRDSNGHQGVSVGDADGDGLDDLYVAQPAGLPNRLYRNRGDSTFEDITDQAGVGVLDDTAQSLFVDVDNDGDQDLVVATSTNPLLFINDGKGHFTPVPDAFRFARPLQGVLTSITMADYDRDGFLDLYLCVYSYFFGAGEDKAGTPAPYYDARNGPPGVLFRNDGHGRFVDATHDAGLDAGNDRYHFAAAWADYDGDGWPDLLVANDFGTKNLYHNLGRRDGKVRFEDVAASAGVLDHGAGMSAAFLDYDNDGLLDIYTGNMWSAPGLRVTSAPTFMPDATPDVRALYRRHARGNSLFRNLGNGRFEDKTLEAHAEMGRWAWSSDALDFDSDGWDDLYIVNGMLTRKTDAAGGGDLEGFFWRQVVARSPLTRVPGTPYDDAWRAINQLLIHGSIASRQRNVFLRNDGHGGYDEISGAVGLDLDQDGRSFAVLDIDGDGDPDLAVMADRQAPQLRIFRNDFEAKSASLAVRLRGTKSNRDAIGARVTVETDRRPQDQNRAGRFRVPVAALEGAAHRSGRERARLETDGQLALGRNAGVHGCSAEHSHSDRRRG